MPFTDESNFNTEAAPCCMSLKYGPSGEIQSVRIGDKDGRLLDEFSFGEGIFSPVEDPLKQNGLIKPKFGLEADFFKRRQG